MIGRALRRCDCCIRWPRPGRGLMIRIWCRMLGWYRRCGWSRTLASEELVAEHVQVAAEVGANPGVKVGCLVAGMIAGADGMEGMDLLRHGAIPATFAGIRAPWTLGSFLRAFTQGSVRQLAAVHRRVLARGARRTAPAARCRVAGLHRCRFGVAAGVGGQQAGRGAWGTPRSPRSHCWCAAWARWWPWCPRRWPRRWSRPPGCGAAPPAPPVGRPACSGEALGTARAAGTRGMIMV
jgi:hypothetical protein